MRRLPVVVFAVLALATVAAFFIIQHLKVTTPLISGTVGPFPSAINPVGGQRVVKTPAGQRAPVNFRQTKLSFYLLHRSDNVDVYVVNESGTIVATLASGMFMRAELLPHPPVIRTFTWTGRVSGGGVAPPGLYYIKVALRHQGRTIDIKNSAGQLEWITVTLSTPCPRGPRP